MKNSEVSGPASEVSGRIHCDEFRHLISALPSLVWACGTDGRIHEVNDRWLRYTGQTAEQASTAKWIDFIHPADFERVSQHWENVTSAGLPFETELRYRSKSGEYHNYVVHSVPCRDDAGQIIGWFAINNDLESNVRQEQSLLGRYRSILDAAVDAIITIDEHGIIESINSAAEDIFGYDAAEVVGKNIRVLMPEPYHSQHDGYIAKYLESGEKKVIGVGREVEGLRKNGTIFPMDLAVSEVQFANRRLFTGIVRDISELKEAQERVVQSERLAAIGEMVTGLAHESRNALQRAQACLDMLSLDLQDQPEQLDLTRRTKSALDDLHRLYEEVKGYAAPIHIERIPGELSSIWRRAWDNLSVMRENRTIELIEHTHEVDLNSRVDRYRIEQVFRNILENAIAACPEPGTIEVNCAAVELDGRPCVQIQFRDNGSGIEQDAAERIFKPFYTTKQKGTGLGMAIVKRIVELHDGRIEIGRKSPAGAEIIVTLPR